MTNIVKPFTLFNQGDGRLYLNNMVFYTKFFMYNKHPNISKAMAITLHRYFIWKEDPGIMEAYLSNVKLLNELNIERNHLCVQRQLPSNTPNDFNVVYNACQRAALQNRLGVTYNSFLGQAESDGDDLEEYFIYDTNAAKD